MAQQALVQMVQVAVEQELLAMVQALQVQQAVQAV
jgi:hypothetical protein